MPYIKQLYHAPVTFTGTSSIPRLVVPHIKVNHRDKRPLRAVQNEYGNFTHYTGSRGVLLSQESCVIDCTEWADAAGPTVFGGDSYYIKCIGTVSPSKNCSVTVDPLKYRAQGLGVLTEALEATAGALIRQPSVQTTFSWWKEDNWDYGLLPLEFYCYLHDIAIAVDSWYGGSNCLYLLVDEFHINGTHSTYWAEYEGSVNYLKYLNTSSRNGVPDFSGDRSCLNYSGTYTDIDGMPLRTDILQNDLPTNSNACHACHNVLFSFSTSELKTGTGNVYWSPIFAKPYENLERLRPQYIALRLSLVSTPESSPYSGSWS